MLYLQKNLIIWFPVEEITNAVICSSNTDVSRDEFRNNISEVLEDERRWEYFAGRSV